MATDLTSLTDDQIISLRILETSDMKLLSTRRKGNSPYRYTDFRLPNGDRIQRSTGVLYDQIKKAKEEARLLYVKLSTEIDRDKTLGSKLLSIVIPEYITAQNSNPNDIRSLKWILKTIGDIPIGKIKRDHFIKLQIKGMKAVCPESGKTVKPQTVNRKIRPLRALLNKSVKWGYIEYCPYYDELKEAPPKIRVPFTAEEQMKIIQACGATGNSHYQDFFTVLIHTGRRLTTVINMKKKDIHNEGEYWILPTQKNDTHNEKVVFSDETKKIIQRNMKNSPSDYVFYNPLSKRGDMGNCKKAWKTIRTHAGVNKDWHTCKTTAMTRAIDNDFSDQNLMTHFGHKDIRSIKHYSRSNTAHKKELSNRAISSS